MADPIKIDQLNFQHDHDRIVVTLSFRNESDRTWYAFATPRHIFYDTATKRATLELFERVSPTPAATRAMFVSPRFEMLEPGRTTTLRLKVPPVIKRLLRATPGQQGIRVEELPIRDADVLNVKVAISDVPFYADTRSKEPLGKEDDLSVGQWEQSLMDWCAVRLMATCRRWDSDEGTPPP